MEAIMAAKVDDEGPMPKLVRLLSSLLERVAESNDGRAAAHKSASVFEALTRPSISIHTYLQRIFKYANCSPACYIVAYIYLDRFTRRHPALPINSFNLHRLLITTVLLSAKFMDDMYYNNAYYAKVGGISTKEMNVLEVDLLFGLGFHLNVTPSTFHTYCCHLEREMKMMQPPPHLNISDHHCLLFKPKQPQKILHMSTVVEGDPSSSHQLAL